MEKTVIEKSIKEEICNLLGEKTDIDSNTILINTGLKSIDCIKLLVFAEEYFDITFDDSDLIGIKNMTIQDIINTISKLMNH